MVVPRRQAVVLVLAALAATLAVVDPASARSAAETVATHLQTSQTPASGSLGRSGDPNLVLTKILPLADDDVWAVGSDNGYPDYTPVVEHWDGSSWHRASLRVPSGSTAAFIDDAAAVSPTDIYAVGFWVDSQFEPQEHPLLEHWDGSRWNLLSLRSSDDVLTLSAASVLSGKRVYLIGARFLEQPAVFVGHGKTFRRVRDRSPAAYVGRVSAVSSTDAWSAGLQGGPTYPYRLLEHWNGKRWTDATPGFVDQSDVVSDIDMASSDSVWATGFVSNSEGGAAKALLLHYDGAAWRMVSPPQHRALFYSAVSFAQPDDGWLVGLGNKVEHFDGTSWSAVRLPITKAASIRDVKALSPTDAWAIGYGASSTVALHWDGIRWTKIANP